jgi:ATP synthase protein I
MKTTASRAEDRDDELTCKPLTADEARRLRERQPLVSPWRVIGGQVLVGCLAALVAWVVTGRRAVGWSAGYGALAVVLPAAVFARGLTGRLASLNAGAAAAGFMVWEMVKIALTVAMLVAAPRLVPQLSWPALLVGLVLALKVYWVALAYSPKRKLKN